VSIIDDFTFGDLSSFKSQFARLTNNDNFDDLKERLKPICKRTLRRQVLEYVKYTNRIPITQEFYPTENEQNLYDLVSEYLQRQNLYALPASQRQLMTLILRKLLASSTYAISGTLDALGKKLDAIVENQETVPILESTISGDFETFDEIKDEWTEDACPELDSGTTIEKSKTYTPEEIRSIKEESKSLKEFHSLAKSIQKNSKGEVLLTALKAGFAEAERRGGSKKAVIFTESTRTQKYLENILENTEYNRRIVLFNGSNTDHKSQAIYKQWIEKHHGTDRITGSKSADIRAALVEYFRDEAIIMIATEAGAEGINLQFCSLVVNYDLPWNPQRIEQRIGRCHRYGQKHDVVVVNFLNKKNAADQRVYQLLSEKFKLFEGVFGASDEVLGSIESGVDFEKRIAQIYQQCRTEEEIQSAFDTLQKEMETQIDETMSLTRQRLLENFDEEVHEKLRINLKESREYLSRYENWLWQVTKYYLDPYADFSGDGYSFMLRENPFSSEPIHPGPYRIGKNIEDANIYRIGHPLAQRIIDKCKSLSLDSREVVFDYSNTPKRISILEPLVGKAGWLTVVNLTIYSFESEDHILFCGITDNGLELDIEQCQRLFSLSAIVKPLQTDIAKESISKTTKPVIPACRESFLKKDAGQAGMTNMDWIPDQVRNDIEQIAHKQQAEILQITAERNGGFFDTEMEKLDKWADDVKSSIEIELKELDREIKARKTEAKKILKLEEKVKTQRQIKEMEKKRNELRQNLYQAQDEIDLKKENLINEIESRMKQKTETNELFTIKWKIV
ncbi:MAG: helicase-related protein, partial [Chloroflexota bacterium]